MDAAVSAFGQIDILMNNAGVYDPSPSFGRTDYDGWAHTFAVNTMAVLRMAEAFVDQVARSERKTIAAISSGMGSIEGALIGALIVGITRAAAGHLVPQLELFVIYAVMALVLGFRPYGLFSQALPRKI